jgi:hypothetical protein
MEKPGIQYIRMEIRKAQRLAIKLEIISNAPEKDLIQIRFMT